jgi:hypothetical protein
MDNKKFEKLIDLIINEDQEKAEQLFHEIVVEKSREIYESIMDEEMMGMDEGGMDEGMGGQVGDLLDEINAEEMSEAEGEDMDDMAGDEEIIDIDADEMGDDQHDEIEDAVVRIEDKLDQLMAEFEELMGGDEEGEEGEEDFGDEEGEEAGEEGEEEAGEEDLAEETEEMEEEVMEAITLKKVSVTHGDNGANTKSPALHDPKVKAAGVNPVKFSGASEAVPTSPKGPSNAYSKGETQVPGAGKFKNAPAQAGQDLEAAPKPKHGDSGSNTKSPLGESKKIIKKRV